MFNSEGSVSDSHAIKMNGADGIMTSIYFHSLIMITISKKYQTRVEIKHAKKLIGLFWIRFERSIVPQLDGEAGFNSNMVRLDV